MRSIDNKYKKEVAAGLKEFIVTYKFSEFAIANKIEISVESVKEILSGDFDNISSDEWDKVIEFIEAFKKDFYDTELAGIIFRMCNDAHNKKSLVVITSNSGAGKTTGVQRYGIINSHALYIRVTGVFTKRYLLQKIMKALGNPVEGLENFAMFESILKLLAQQPYTIIIDEAERLPVHLVELLRDIYDHGNVALVLVGLHSLKELLVHGRNRKKDKLVQVSSRVDYQKVVDILKPKDVQMVFNDRIEKHSISQKKMESIAKAYEHNGGMRAIIKLSNLINELFSVNKEKVKSITDEFVDAAINKLTLK